MTLVSVITPTYNSSNYIGDTIQSVQSQSFQDWEMIICDDCSQDNTREIIKTFHADDPRIQLITTKINSGPAVSRNTAIENSQGRFIAFLDSDDLWNYNKLEIQLSFMQKNQVPFSFTSYKRIFTNYKYESLVNAPNSISYGDLLYSCKIGCSTVMYDTEIIGKVFMPPVQKGQDWGLWLKILRNGFNAQGIKDVLTIYRVGNGSVSSNKLIKSYCMWEICRNYEKLSLIRSIFCLLSFVVYKIINITRERIVCWIS